MTYETKDSGARAEFDSGMVRDTDDGKARFDLVMAEDMPYAEQLVTRWAELMARGAVKYNARNWEKAAGKVELDRFMGSALRHMIQWFNGEDDEDHAAAICFNVSGAEYVKWRQRQEPDDSAEAKTRPFVKDAISKYVSVLNRYSTQVLDRYATQFPNLDIVEDPNIPPDAPAIVVDAER